MKRFADAEAEDLYRTGSSARLRKHVARRAHWSMHLLTAARTVSDVRVIGRITRWPKKSGRFGLHVEGKWFVTFDWEDLIGPFEIRIERG
jgi:plasmid maintenance system killer protein